MTHDFILLLLAWMADSPVGALLILLAVGLAIAQTIRDIILIARGISGLIRRKRDDKPS